MWATRSWLPAIRRTMSRSPPAENALPAPVITATLVSGSAETSAQTRASSPCICSSAALYLSGRSIVMSSTPWSRRSKRSCSYSENFTDCSLGARRRRGPAQLIVRPPLTLTVWPVTKDASSEARNATTLATSAGWPSRRNGIALVRASRSFGPANDANSAVSVGPGHTQLTRTWWRAISRASDLVKAMIPPLAAEYTASPDEPTRPASEPRFTTAPLPWAAMTGSTALQACSTPYRLIAIARSQSAGSESTNGLALSQPALLTSTSIRPNCSATRLDIAWTPWRSVTSARIATAPGSSSAVVVALASSTSVTTTLAPSAASFWAIALPMPCPPPVTIVILPSSLPMNGSSLVCGAGLRPILAVVTGLNL